MSDVVNDNPLFLSGRRAVLLFAAVAATLAVLIPVTAWVGRVESSRASANMEARRGAFVEREAQRIRSRFDRLQEELFSLAWIAAEEPVVREALRDMRGGESPLQALEDEKRLIRWFDRLEVPDWTAVELYADDGSLLGWSGFSLPMKQMRPDVPVEEPVTRFVSGATGREGLETWVTVAEEGRLIGLIRVVRLARLSVRVASDYLKPYSLATELAEGIRADVQIRFGDAAQLSGGSQEEGQVVELRGVDGTILGLARIGYPGPDIVLAGVSGRFGDVMAFWAALLAGWLVFGTWLAYRSWRHRTATESGPFGPRQAVVALGMVLVPAVLLRYVLLALDVPGRWFPDAPIFDPRNLASTIAGGAARSVGDLLLSAVFLLALAMVMLDVAGSIAFPQARGKNLRFREVIRACLDRAERPSIPKFGLGIAALATVPVLLAWGLDAVVRRVILDSTLDYFAWTGLAPEPLVLLVLTTLLLLTLVAFLALAAIFRAGCWWLSSVGPPAGSPLRSWLGAAVCLLVPLVSIPWLLGAPVGLILWIGVALLGIGLWIAAIGLLRGGEWERLLFLKSTLGLLLLATAVVYPLVYQSMMLQRQMRMEEVADDYVARKDAEVRIVVDEVIGRSGTWNATTDLSDVPPFWTLFEGAPLPFGGEYGVTALLLDDGENLLGTARTEGAPLLEQSEQWGPVFSELRTRWSSGIAGTRVFGRSGDLLGGQTPVFAGLESVDWGGRRWWLLVLAAPRTVRFARQDPEDLGGGLRAYPDWRRKLSVAEYRDGLLVRAEGGDFGRMRLPDAVAERLGASSEVWSSDDVYGQPYSTFYRRQAEPENRSDHSVIAVRTRATISYDHLYYLLRISVAGLLLGLLFYVGGVAIRHRAGRLGIFERRFSDRVLAAFLGVGAFAVVLTGWFGQNVISRENQGAIQSRLERRLERVQHAITRLAAEGESALSVLSRVSLDALADELSLDINVYRTEALWKSSATDEQEQLLVYSRLPARAYEELYLEGYERSFVTLDAEGEALFTIGYQAFNGPTGEPEAVVAVLTIPEQERIREERSRTTAYLFGALLLLLLVVMGTATVLANRLSRPIRRLREGIRAVAQGRFLRPIPVETRDEVGALVESFNLMQQQLVESRRQLAQQERELAWREMAKQVAHEIKNPLTPMKLSIQHLQRAFRQSSASGSGPGDFGRLFERITATLTEQIDTLAHIANEFYTFARLPKRHVEDLDLGGIALEAVDLMREETDVRIDVEVPGDPIVVRGDRDEVRRVYINLLKNAVQAMPVDASGRVSVRIRVEQGENGDALAISSVSDNGMGIPAEIRDRIFQPNFSTKTSGMGLGLAITKKSVEDMNGHIFFETAEGAGTTFTIELPVADHTNGSPRTAP